MTPIISDSPASCTGTNTLWENPTFELDKAKNQQITLEWIQSLSPELKDTVLYRLCRAVESKPTLVEAFAINQVLYRTISGGTFTESADHVAKRTGCDRKTILKGLSIAVGQNILGKSDRPGTSTEYFFKPVEEWKPEPVRIADIHTKKVIEFPLTQNTDEGENNETSLDGDDSDRVVHETDDPETDPNNVIVVNKILNKQQLEVSIPISDTPSIWRNLPDGNRYAQIPPIYDQETGVEIQRQMEQEGLTAQGVVGRAIAFSKVPLMLLEMLANIGRALANSSLKAQAEQSLPDRVLYPAAKSVGRNLPSDELRSFAPTVTPVEVVVSLQLSKTLEMIGVNMNLSQLHKCVTEYSEDVMLLAANELKRTGALANKENPTGYFLGCLKNGMGQNSAIVQKVEPQEQENIKLNDETTEMGRAFKKPVKSFSHVETNPRVTIAALIMDGQYQRAAIMSGLYGVDYEELVSECGLADDPEAIILLRKVTRSSP
ncbi:MAG: hypothetical protein PUP91_32445 [Rhizonema sp. PD37]|nr:hypothetical protein [Rhizonema sp. PD37]